MVTTLTPWTFLLFIISFAQTCISFNTQAAHFAFDENDTLWHSSHLGSAVVACGKAVNTLVHTEYFFLPIFPITASLINFFPLLLCFLLWKVRVAARYVRCPVHLSMAGAFPFCPRLPAGSWPCSSLLPSSVAASATMRGGLAVTAVSDEW